MCKILTRGFILACSIFIFLPAHASDDLSYQSLSKNFKNGFEDGYWDAAEGVRSLCAAKRCKAQDSYERGYTLGYKKRIQENGHLPKNLLTDPLIDSPGKTIGSDFNGDGIHDIIVGAHLNDDGGNTAGAAYIFFGASGLSGTKNLRTTASADVTILGKGAVESDIRLGNSVSSAGDINGDGIDDIIVGAYKNDDVATNAGAAYIFFGATNLSGTKNLRTGGAGQSADVTLLGKAASDYLGQSVSSAGDVNGDGFDDIIVGANGNDDAATGAGAAYIFFGAINLSGTKNLGGGQSADVTLLGKAASDYLGQSVSSAGDVNGDGFDDIIVGAYGNDDSGINAGASYIFFGARNLSGTKSLGKGQSADVTLLGKAAYDYLGKSVSGAGDINGDGFDDIIVGAHQNDDSADSAGASYIFFGASGLSGTKSLGQGQSADVTLLGKAASDQLGKSVSGAGDINDDGFNDIIVGADGNDDSASAAGAAYIFFGARNLSGTKSLGKGQSADVTVLGKAASDYLGISVSGAGDVNSDGLPDIIVGAYKNDDSANTAGAAYIFFGASGLSGTKNLNASDTADIKILGKAANDRLGNSVGGGRSSSGP